MRFIAIALILFFTLQAGPVFAGTSSGEIPQLLDINAANAATLAETLPGIGPAKAALIVQWREQNGAFKHVDQLQEVKGIGPKTVEKLRPYIRVGSEAAARRMQMQHDKQEAALRTDIRRIINAATLSAQPASISALPTKSWYRKSILEILRAH